jgi:drug/metabolite transporter (DMT)-like permease
MKDRSVLLLWLIMILIGGSNAVAVRFSNAELPPFWGAAFRFGAAALIFWGIVLFRRLPLPAGRLRLKLLLFGLFNIGVNYALLYWALVFVPSVITMVVLSLGPLFTFFFAVAHGQERFRWLGLTGALVAFGGIVLGVGDQLGGSLPLVGLLALIASAALVSETSVLYKTLPPTSPLVVNALALTAGTAILLVISVLAGEAWALPVSSSGWLAYGYLVLLGSGALFLIYLLVLDRWTASATSYAFLLFPIATIIIASLLTDEVVTLRFLLGTAVVLVGVWVGALWRPKPISHSR